MKKTLEWIVISLYFIGLLAYPIYKVFIEPQIQIDNIATYFAMAFNFFLYLVGWWFLYTPIWWIIGVVFFWKGDDAKDMRNGCGYPSLTVVVLIVSLGIYNKCNNDTSNATKTNEIYAPIKDDRNDNENNRVYICTGQQSKRYHRSPYCRGLRNCSDEIEEVDVETAEEYDRTPCRICY